MNRRRRVDRYSRFVATLKVGLPLTALALLASVIMLGTRDEVPGGLTFSAADLEALGTGMQVKEPRFSGASLDGDLYDFQANAVVPRDATLEFADIDALEGTIRFRDGRSVFISADTAEIDFGAEQILLRDSIYIESSDGYTAQGSIVVVDLEAGLVRGSGGITAEGPFGEITSRNLLIQSKGDNSLETLANDALMTFTEGVSLRYQPGAQPGGGE
ncbi:MAG: hypothetical protein AAFY59_00785 [Pseudomonadota bacterium]